VRARAIIAGLVLGATFAAAAPARAADEVAAAHYKKGRSLYNVSEYKGALEEFKAAYVVHEDPALLYNIAQCHRMLGNHREAITFYKRFLKEEPGAKNRKEIERLIGELEAKAGEAPPPAQEAAAPPSAAPPAASAPEPTPVAVAAAPTAPAGHAGLHLELALGGGALHDDFTWLGITTGTATGGSGAFQLAATYGLSARFALGGLLMAESVQSPKVTIGGAANNSVDLGLFSFLGLAADYRLDAGPTGWHFEGALGGARITIKDAAGVASPRSPVGGGLVLAAGHDWALGPNWQLGGLLRFFGGSLSDQGVTHHVTTGSLLLCLGYH
jgi:hypothetical protein